MTTSRMSATYLPSDQNAKRRDRKSLSGKKFALESHPPSRGDTVSPTGTTPKEVASWADSPLDKILKKDKAYQLFRNFLAESFASENLNFLEAIEEYNKAALAERPKLAKEIFDSFSESINISSGHLVKMKAALDDKGDDLSLEKEQARSEVLELTGRHVWRLLESDLFPRFKKSEIYLSFLSACATPDQVRSWATGIDGLLGDQLGRWTFRKFLVAIRADENLRFWEAVAEYRKIAALSSPEELVRRAARIHAAFLETSSPNEVSIPSGMKVAISRRIAAGLDSRGASSVEPLPHIATPQQKHVPLRNRKSKNTKLVVDAKLFDSAAHYVEEILRNDPYNRFLLSKEYVGLLRRVEGASASNSPASGIPMLLSGGTDKRQASLNRREPRQRVSVKGSKLRSPAAFSSLDGAPRSTEKKLK